jgi:hypothetical protein
MTTIIWLHTETDELPLAETKDMSGNFSGAIIYIKNCYLLKFNSIQRNHNLFMR